MNVHQQNQVQYWQSIRACEQKHYVHVQKYKKTNICPQTNTT